MKNLLKFKLSIATLLMAACVTINVYFPAGAAEKAADQIIDSVIRDAAPSRGSSATTPGTAAPTSTPPQGSSTMPAAERVLRFAAERALELLLPAAQAQAAANIDVSSPEIRAITASMQERFASLEKFFDSGVIGLTAEGLIDVRDIAAAALPDRALVRRLVGEDNADRNALYAAISRANNRPEWEADIRRIFAQRWIERGAKPGWYFRDLEGNWKQR